MSRPNGPGVPTRAPVAPSTVVAVALIALCSLLLLKWLAVVALVALGLAALVWWARRDPTRPCDRGGLPGGHRDERGRPLRSRHLPPR